MSMKKSLLSIAVIVIFSGAAFAQQFICTDGKTHFFSKAPLEDIEATSLKTVCAINTNNRKVFSKIAIQSFVFRDKLMQEHFNENYLESDKFPYSTFDAEIKGAIDFLKDGIYDVTLSGVLDMHGVKQTREIKGKLYIEAGVPVRATADYIVKLKDHKIKIPKAVLMNIAEEIKVDVDFTFVKYEKK
jgi:hypothetical protein